MVRTSAVAVHAAGVAMLESEEAALVHLLALADGESGGLHEARDLLRTVSADPERVRRADAMLELAIARVERDRGD